SMPLKRIRASRRILDDPARKTQAISRGYFQPCPVLRKFRGAATFVAKGHIMKMLFFSSDPSEVQSVAKAFDDADIPCEVRKGVRGIRSCPHPREMELWIRNDKDCHRALMLCVQLG